MAQALLMANINWNAYNNFGGRSNYMHPVSRGLTACNPYGESLL